MSFWRREVIDFALDHETRRHVEEQREWITREPSNPTPYYNLAQLYRMSGRQEDALGLLLQAVSLNDRFGEAHSALAELYAVLADYPAAWRHARAAEQAGCRSAAELLARYNIPE